MKIFNYKKHKMSKNFLMAASAYRRSIKDHHDYSTFDFSISALKEQYGHETYGDAKPNPKINGYTYGKSIFGITMAGMEEDLMAGLFCKYELLQGAGALKRKLISNMLPQTFYPWRNNGKM